MLCAICGNQMTAIDISEDYDVGGFIPCVTVRASVACCFCDLTSTFTTSNLYVIEILKAAILPMFMPQRGE